MPSTLTLTGPTFTNALAKAMPAIPALQTLCFFGTSGDGINANRAPGGPALSVMSGAPVYSPSYVSLGLQSGRQDVLETNNPRSTAVLASGWTYAAVTRIGGATTLQSVVVSELNGTPVGASMSMLSRYSSSAASQSFLYQNGTRATISNVTTFNNWHFTAATYGGGAANNWTLYDFTDQPTTGMPQVYAQVGYATGAQSPHFGGAAADFSPTAIDMAFGMVAFSPLSAGALSTLAASVRSFLARRGVAC